MAQWQPISLNDFETLLGEELENCQPEEQALFERTKLPVGRLRMRDTAYLETAYVVARYGDEILYYNDIEGGFNTSPVDDAGAILEYWCNQDTLQGALYRWLHPELFRADGA